MNKGCFMLVSNTMFSVAEDLCGDDWEIRITPIKDFIMFALDWCTVNDTFFKHYRLPLANDATMSQAMAQVHSFKYEMERIYSEEVIPV